MTANAVPTQNNRSIAYAQLETLLRTYSPPFTQCPSPKVGKKRSYGPWSEKDVEIAGRKFPAVYFATVIEQKHFVGFYYMPVYMKPEIAKRISPQLMKTLKGKSCFHIKSLDAAVLSDVKAALDLAVKLYQKNGWL